LNFNDVSSKYENISLVQASAGDVLIELLDICKKNYALVGV